MSFKNPVGIIAANRLPIGKINGFYKKFLLKLYIKI